MDLAFVRHAEPVRTVAGTVSGPADPGLTELGFEQSRRLAAWLALERVDIVLSSPMRRARETAAPIAAALGLEVEIVDGLVEYDATSDDYIPMDELQASGDPRWLAMVEGRWEDFGADPAHVFKDRVARTVEEIVARFPGQRVVAVCHGGVVNCALASILEIDRYLWFEPVYTSISRVIASRSGIRSVVSLNERAHLEANARPGRGRVMSTVNVAQNGPVTIVEINRPEARNAVDGPTATLLADAFRAFAADATQSVAVLTGAAGTFCAGADLKGVADGRGNRVTEDGDGPMGPTRMLLDKPVIAAVEGYAVAGGLELALWCDLRVAARDAVFGVFCRRFGVPLVDGGTVRLPRLIGHSHALDLILTGRAVSGDEAVHMGLVNRLVEPGAARAGAVELALELAALPQVCMRNDRRSSYEQWALPIDDALRNEYRHGIDTVASGETRAGATRFSQGAGRHGAQATPSAISHQEADEEES